MVNRQPPKKKAKRSRAHSGRDLQETNHKLVEKRIQECPTETFRSPGNGLLECQACGKELKCNATTIKRHLDLSSFAC